MAVIHDVVVIGLGGMGSAAAWHLARRGLSVVAVEQFDPAHERGSSHGLSRIIRLAYFEHPSYVPLLQRAFSLWRELESVSGEELLHVTGGLDAGRPGSRVFEGSRESCAVHDLPHEILDAGEVKSRFPAYHLPPEFRAVFQPDAGFLEPEKCITTHVRLAVASGATVMTGREVTAWSRVPGGVVVRLGGDEIRARQVVLAAGAWMPKLVPSLARVLRPERQVVAWFEVADAQAFDPARFPVFVLTTDDGIFYGFPQYDVPGFKIGKIHHLSEPVDPDRGGRTVDAHDESVLRQCVQSFFPGADGPVLRSSTCIFTNTPDEHFIIDRLPEAPEALVVSACSGHGFKFAPAIGEMVAERFGVEHRFLDIPNPV